MSREIIYFFLHRRIFRKKYHRQRNHPIVVMFSFSVAFAGVVVFPSAKCHSFFWSGSSRNRSTGEDWRSSLGCDCAALQRQHSSSGRGDQIPSLYYHRNAGSYFGVLLDAWPLVGTVFTAGKDQEIYLLPSALPHPPRFRASGSKWTLERSIGWNLARSFRDDRSGFQLLAQN